MSTRYDQYCPVARALEVVGERWTLLIARELLFGPRRFTDIYSGLPGISTNVLASRLKDLEGAGLVGKRTLPPPAASVVYELTADAAGLAAVLAAAAEWGMQLLSQPRPDDQVRSAWLVLALAVTASPIPPAGGRITGTYELRVTDAPEPQTFHLLRQGEHLQPMEGPAADPDVVITMAAETLVAIASGDLDPTSEAADDVIATTGDAADARQLLAAMAPA